MDRVTSYGMLYDFPVRLSTTVSDSVWALGFASLPIVVGYVSVDVEGEIELLEKDLLLPPASGSGGEITRDDDDAPAESRGFHPQPVGFSERAVSLSTLTPRLSQANHDYPASDQNVADDSMETAV